VTAFVPFFTESEWYVLYKGPRSHNVHSSQLSILFSWLCEC